MVSKRNWDQPVSFCQRLLNMIIWVKYVAKKFKNFLIKLHNNTCAKKKKAIIL